MANIHSEQIQRLTEREDFSPLGYIFDSHHVLIGTIDDTSESALAISLLGQPLCDEAYPEPGDTGNEHYYRLCDRLQQMGYFVVDAEWWRQRIEPGYSIEAIPLPADSAPQEKPVKADSCPDRILPNPLQAWVALIYPKGADRETTLPVERSVFWAADREEAEAIAARLSSEQSFDAEWNVYQDDDEAESLA